MISIIANFYNSGPHIDRLVDSVLAQTHTEWELVCVDDCSPGNDAELLRRRAAERRAKGRIRVVRLDENAGITRAKMAGIKEARGEWLTFIDGDDRLRPQALEAMATAAGRTGAEMVVMNCRRVIDLPGTHIPLRTIPLRTREVDYDRAIGADEMRERWLRAFFGHNILSGYAYWGKLYSRGVIERSEYEVPDVTLYEDLFFVLHAALAARSVVFTGYEGYDWRWGGLSSGSTLKHTSQVADFKPLQVARHFDSFYHKRVDLIDRYKIAGALSPLRRELRNVLWSTFSLSAVAKPGSGALYDTLMREMKEIVALPAYRSLTVEDAVGDDDVFLRQIAAWDIEGAYLLAREEYRRHALKRFVKRMLS